MTDTAPLSSLPACGDNSSISGGLSLGHLSATIGHLANIATRVGRALDFDPATEQILGDEEATLKDSLADGLLEHAHYTRPADYRGWKVPDVLRNGDHAEIARWRYEDSLRRTIQRRPDLIRAIDLQGEHGELIRRIADEEGFQIDDDPS